MNIKELVEKIENTPMQGGKNKDEIARLRGELTELDPNHPLAFTSADMGGFAAMDEEELRDECLRLTAALKDGS